MTRLRICSALVVALLLTACGGESAPSRPAGVPQRAVAARVVRIVDGDTFVVTIGDAQETVRMVGIDTPETKKPNTPIACYGPEASARATELLDGRTVWLERDVTDRDRYGRLLRYVWLGGDGAATLVNETLVAGGYAVAYDYKPDIRESGRLHAAAAAAQAAGLGLWGACPGMVQPTSVAAPTLAAGTVVPGAPVGWSGGDVNCDDFATQAQAQRFFEAQGGPGRDRHQLDSDGNGLACESLP